MNEALHARVLRRVLIIGNLSYKFRSHVELAVVGLVISTVLAITLPWYLYSFLRIQVSEVHTVTRAAQASVLAYHAQTGRWPTGDAPLSAQALRERTKEPEGVYFDAVRPGPNGALRVVPNERLTRAALLGERSYWLTPIRTTHSPDSPIVWTCASGVEPPVAPDFSHRRAESPHLPLNFCP